MTNQPPRRTGLLELLRNSVGSQFVIPVYQRNYTWTANKEVKQYIDDLCAVLENKYDKHFLGIMIYLDTPLDSFSREFSVIDGQQRLTTTFLMLYAIRDLLNETKDPDNINLASQLENQYLNNQFVQDKLKFKLKPLVNDDDVYQQIINKDLNNIKNTDSNIYKNYIYAKDRINDLNKNGFSFNQILMAMDNLYLVCVPLSSNDNAQKIFESINSTGAKLTASDLIRNYILMTIPSDDQEIYYKNYWNEIEKSLNNNAKKLEGFFRIYLAIKYKRLCNINSVYSTFKEYYEEMQKIGLSPKDILSDIKDYAKGYNDLYYLDITKFKNPIKNELIDYRKIDSEMPAPLILEFYKMNQNLLISDDIFANLMKIINSYLIRRALCSLDTSSITRIFPTILNDTLSSCKPDYSNIDIALRKHLINANKGKSSYVPDDKELREHLWTDNMYILRSQLRIVLEKIENLNNSAPVDLKELSVEHLMPQDGKKWLTKLNLTEDEYLMQRNRLGNLTLISKKDNSKAQNNIWEYKVELFSSTSHLKLNEDILKLPDWTTKEIDDRTTNLTNKIISLFPYYAVPSSDLEIIHIHLFSSNPNLEAKALFYLDNGAVEVQKGSDIENYRLPHENHLFDELYDQLLEDGIIEETNDGAVFKENYTFYSKTEGNTGLSTSAGFIQIGSRNGKEYWLDETNQSINKNQLFKNSKFK